MLIVRCFHFKSRHAIILLAGIVILSACGTIKKTERTPAAQPDIRNTAGNIPDAPSRQGDVPVAPVLKKREPYVLVKPDDAIATKYALALGVKKSAITNGRLYDFIEQWKGTPYLFAGLDRAGIDCSGFVYLLQQQVYDIGDMPRSSNLQINFIKRKYEQELKEGDLVFFDFEGKPFSHVGVYLQNGYVVHASTSKGVVIVKLHSPYLYKYFSRGGSVIDPADPSTFDTAGN